MFKGHLYRSRKQKNKELKNRELRNSDKQVYTPYIPSLSLESHRNKLSLPITISIIKRIQSEKHNDFYQKILEVISSNSLVENIIYMDNKGFLEFSEKFQHLDETNTYTSERWILNHYEEYINLDKKYFSNKNPTIVVFDHTKNQYLEKNLDVYDGLIMYPEDNNIINIVIMDYRSYDIETLENSEFIFVCGNYNSHHIEDIYKIYKKKCGNLVKYSHFVDILTKIKLNQYIVMEKSNKMICIDPSVNIKQTINIKKEISTIKFNDLECKVCFSAKIDTIYKCGHLCCCSNCIAMLDDPEKCPLCNQNVKANILS
jgi:hypothetical protein